jgi:hypothetical protein
MDNQLNWININTILKFVCNQIIFFKMTRASRSPIKKIQSEEDLSSKLSINKNSKTIKRKDESIIEVKNGDNKQIDIWNINSILSSIFEFTDHKDLIEFNTVCKRWNHVTNPIIHRTIKLDNRWDIEWQSHYTKNKNATKIDADVVECISNNSKHAHLVKEFKFNYRLNPKRAVKVFETFRFIRILAFENCAMDQDQFLGMVSRLTQLQELTLKDLSINKFIKKRSYKEAVQLPPSLKKLKLGSINLINIPELFIETINSHNNLVEFSSVPSYGIDSLKPFYKPYPSLKKFEYINPRLETHQFLINTFEHNPQLSSLNLNLNYWNSELTKCISSYLSSLEELTLSDHTGNSQAFTDLKFSQPTNIKRLRIFFYRLGNCSLDSILLNCPNLEDLKLFLYTRYQQPDSEVFLNISKYAKVKKLNINCRNMRYSVVESLLLSCRQLNELVINLPARWKESTKLICENFESLQKLEIYPPRFNTRERDSYYHEFHATEFFTSIPKCQTTLKNFTLSGLRVNDFEAEHFKNFKSLKSIKYSNQPKIYNNLWLHDTTVDMDLWPGYKLYSKETNYTEDSYHVELKRY